MRRIPHEGERLYLQQVPADHYSIYTLSKYLSRVMHFRKCISFRDLYLAMKKETIRAVYLTDGSAVYGFAIYQEVSALKLTHLLYFAVFSEYRSCGLGSQFIQQLSEMCEGRMILEVEGVHQADSCEELINRTRRVVFFQRNGFYLHPETRLEYFGRSLQVMADRKFKGINWEEFYQRLYNRVHVLPVSKFFIKVQTKPI